MNENNKEVENTEHGRQASAADETLLGDVLSLLKIQEDYINFLSEYANKHAEYLQLHGMKPTEYEIIKAQDLRDKLEIYCKKVFIEGKLIERLKTQT